MSQSYVLESDVTHGLIRLLEHNTGLQKLDLLPDPGADEFGRIYAQSKDEELLAKAVLLTVAKLHSPISKYRLLRGQLWAASSPLIHRHSLSREQIERGLDVCIKLDLLEQSTGSPPEISFAIPILGETLNRNYGKYWADIDEDLERLGRSMVS